MGKSGYGQLQKLYDDDWYDYQVRASLESARVYVPFLAQWLRPVSVLDVGCGRGAWLKAWRECGVARALGFDGHWNTAEKMLDPAIEFRQIDLNRRFALDQRVELSMSLEVAEHLEPGSAELFVECLTLAADAVLFSAAISNQGGTNHINERPHSYWAGLFQRQGYATFDLLRPTFWADDRVYYCYRQNSFVYAKQGSPPFRALIERGLQPLHNFNMMDCVHPALLAMRARQLAESRCLSFMQHVKALPGSFRRAIQNRLRKR
jgi:SAM-dependent methyltransferase